MRDDAVRIFGVSRAFASATVVREVDLSVGRGEVYGFLGRNGAGKTTVIRMLLGLIRPTRGRVEVLGAPLGRRRSPAVWARVGCLVESPGLYPDLTVADHLAMAARYRRLASTATAVAVERLGLGQDLATPARALSLGNRQRLGLALALIHRPDLVVLDEPVNGLDPAGVVEVRDLVRELAAEGAAVFLASHLLAEVARVADRVGIIHRGRLIEELPADRLRDAPRRLALGWRTAEAAQRAAAVLGTAGTVIEIEGSTARTQDAPAIAEPERIISLLADAGLTPCSVTVDREDLEAHFLRLTGGAA